MIAGNENTDLPVADVCVIGAGPVGLALALKCEKLGLSVVLLEAGALDGPSTADETFAHVEFTNAHHAAVTAATRRGVGGTSALWGGRCVAFDDIDFAERAHVPYSGWPITHAELRDYYAEAFTFLNCGDYVPHLDGNDIRGHDVQASTIERWSTRPALGPLYKAHLGASKRIAVLTEATVVEIDLDPAGLRTDCVKVYLHGRMREVRARSYVLAGGGLENGRLLLATQRNWPRKFGGPEGALGRFYQGHLTGYIALVEFQNRQVEKSLSFQKNRDGTQFRRRLQISAGAQQENALLNSAFWLDGLSIADAAHGSGAFSALYLPLAFSGIYRILSKGLAPKATFDGQHYRGHLQNMRSDPALFQDIVRCTGNLIDSRLRGRRTVPNPKGRYVLRYHAEQTPIPESRVRLSQSQSNSLLPALKVDYLVNDKDVASVLRSHQFLDRWLSENAIGKLHYLHDPNRRDDAVFRQAFDGYHQIGLARMSASPRDGVVNTDCRLHDVTNLYVAGSAVFPTGGQANPTLPAVALALRLGTHLATVRGCA
jgi:choline dehydrogenase-like flavoprotein